MSPLRKDWDWVFKENPVWTAMQQRKFRVVTYRGVRILTDEYKPTDEQILDAHAQVERMENCGDIQWRAAALALRPILPPKPERKEPKILAPRDMAVQLIQMTGGPGHRSALADMEWAIKATYREIIKWCEHTRSSHYGESSSFHAGRATACNQLIGRIDEALDD